MWKLADFGLTTEGSSKTNRPTQYARGTPGYRAPELMDSEGSPGTYNNKVDVWAMGCILYELAIGNCPFKSDWDVLKYSILRKNMDVVLDESFDPHSVETITKHIVDMLQITPTDRPSASVLSKEFDRELQLAHHNVQLRTIASSVPLLEVTDDTDPTPATPQTPQIDTNEVENESASFPLHLIQGRYVSLYQAADWGDIETVKALLDAKVDVNAEGGLLGNALQAGSFGGRKEVVQLLLEKGAYVNAQGGEYGNALQAASAAGREAVVRLLLEEGADVNAQGGLYGNALQAASATGREAVVRLLLEKGADVNAQGGLFGNALEAALFSNHTAVAELLWEYGAKRVEM